MSIGCYVFCFFKQKTAYEMRISDWSSDVCSSDLMGIFGPSNDMLTVMVKSATGLVMLALPLLRLFAAGGPGWGEAIAVGQPIIPTLDIAFLLTGVWLVRNCWQAIGKRRQAEAPTGRSEEHTSELQSLMRISYAVFCLKKKTKQTPKT